MRHELRLAGPAFELKPVLPEHAGFIFNLRRDDALNTFIHETPDDYQLHLDWMSDYFRRTDDYYFVVVERRSQRLQGTCALYNLDPVLKQGEWGRWLICPSSLAATESAFLLYSLAFEKLGLAEVVCRTAANNKRVLSFHSACGLRVNKVEPKAVSIDGESYALVEHALHASKWESLKPMLLAKSELAASLLHRSFEARAE